MKSQLPNLYLSENISMLSSIYIEMLIVSILIRSVLGIHVAYNHKDHRECHSKADLNTQIESMLAIGLKSPNR